MVIQANLRDKKDTDIIQAVLQAETAGISTSALVREWYKAYADSGSKLDKIARQNEQILRQQQEILDRLNNGVSINGKEEQEEVKVDLGGLFDD